MVSLVTAAKTGQPQLTLNLPVTLPNKAMTISSTEKNTHHRYSYWLVNRLFVITWLLLTVIPGFASEHSITATEKHERTALDRIIAIVNEDIITASQLDAETRRVRQQLAASKVLLPPAETLRKQILENLVLTQIQLQLAKRHGIHVGDSELNQALAKIAQINGVDEARFRELLKQDGYDYHEFREQMRAEITKRRLRQQLVDSRILISDSQIDRFLADQRRQGKAGEEFHVAHILISIPEAADPKTIAAAQQKAEKIRSQLLHGADFSQMAIGASDSSDTLQGGDLGWRKIGELPTLFANQVVDMSPGEISPVMRSSRGLHILKLLDQRSEKNHVMTQTHARHILLQVNALNDDNRVREQLLALRKRILAGEDFAELARVYSADKATAGHGGDLGWINPGTMVPEFEQAMADLAINDISLPLKTRFGWHIIELLGRRQHDATNEFNRNQARQQLKKRDADTAYSNWLRQIRSEAYVDLHLDDND